MRRELIGCAGKAVSRGSCRFPMNGAIALFTNGARFGSIAIASRRRDSKPKEAERMFVLPVARIRATFYSIAALTVAGVATDAPVWSIAASLFLCVAIPLAVAFQSPEHLRAMFVPSRAAESAAHTRKEIRHAPIH
ncbi:hypothetical protein [Micromonospora aurantiaca (nom. illeg.)]|uniref:hypothetical protein n=1 Tax=Micromonospora aurantiaca (nom. illeg.) TaxID=47850 RepID=UPI0037AF3B11